MKYIAIKINELELHMLTWIYISLIYKYNHLWEVKVLLVCLLLFIILFKIGQSEINQSSKEKLDMSYE